LEQVEVAFINQRDADWLAREGMADLQARKPTADNHHVGPAAHDLLGWIELKKKAFHGLATPACKPNLLASEANRVNHSLCFGIGLNTKNQKFIQRVKPMVQQRKNQLEQTTKHLKACQWDALDSRTAGTT